MTVRQWHRGEADSFGTYDGNRTLLRGAPATGPGFSAVLDRNGKILIRHYAGSGHWESQDGWLSPSVAAFLDINAELRQARLHFYDLPGGQPVSWAPEGTIDDVAPFADLEGRWFAYFTGSPERRMCAWVLDLAAAAPRPAKLQCGDKGTILADPAIYGDQLVLSSLVHPETQTKRCKRLEVMTLPGGDHEAEVESTVNASADCLAWDGTAIAGGTLAWDTMDPFSQERDINPGYALLSDETIESLGRVQTGSMVSCGDWLLWLDGDSNGVVAWRPVLTTPLPVLRPGAQAIATALQCTENRWVTTRVDELTGRNEMLRLIALDTRTALP